MMGVADRRLLSRISLKIKIIRLLLSANRQNRSETAFRILLYKQLIQFGT